MCVIPDPACIMENFLVDIWGSTDVFEKFCVESTAERFQEKFLLKKGVSLPLSYKCLEFIQYAYLKLCYTFMFN